MRRTENIIENSTNVPHRSDATGSLRSGLAPLLFLVLIFVINFIARIILAPLLPTIEKEIRISHGQAGSFFFFMSIGYLFGLLGSGFFACRITHKRTIVVSSAGIGLALVGVSFATSLGAMRLGLLGVGWAAGLYIPSAIASITSLISQEHWGKAIAVHELAPNVAFFIAPFLAELFLDLSTWRTALAALGAASIIASVAYHHFGRGGEFRGESPASRSLVLLAGAPAFWLMLLLFGLGVSATIGVYAMLPLYLVSERHIEPSWANTVVALSRSYGPVFGFFGGWASDRVGAKQTIVVSLMFTGLVTMLLGSAPARWLIAVVLLQPLLAVCFFPAAFAVLAAITPLAARNLAVAFTVPFGFLLGGGAIPAFIGFMGDAGWFTVGFIVTGGLILTGGVSALSLKLPEEHK